MIDSNRKDLTVRRAEWREKDLALLCGIANAGGGRLIMSPAVGSQAQKIRRIHKSFESIPRRTQQELGLVCTAEPVMDGIELCLEIGIPAADYPISYRDDYYLYTDGVNTIVNKEILTRLSADWTNDPETQKLSQPHENDTTPTPKTQHNTESEASLPAAQTPANTKPDNAQDPEHKLTFKERSIAAANRLDMTSTDEFVLKALETNGRVTALRIAEVLGVSESTVRRSFRRLKELGFIERIGSNKSGYWRLID